MRPTAIRRKENPLAEEGSRKAVVPAKSKKAEDITRESRRQDSDKRTVADAQVKEGTSQQVSRLVQFGVTVCVSMCISLYVCECVCLCVFPLSKLNTSVVVEHEEKTESPPGQQRYVC